MFIRAYLRASTDQQDALRAKGALVQFAEERGLKVASFYVENVSGASLQRPELFRLLADSHPGDVILLEQVDRLSRLTSGDWEKLKVEIRAKGVKVVALDLPTSWAMMTAKADDFTSRMFAAINDMLLDMLAAIARKDYEDRRRRTAEGLAKVAQAGLLKGKPEDTERNARIAERLRAGTSWSTIEKLEKCSRDTVARVARKMKVQTTA